MITMPPEGWEEEETEEEQSCLVGEGVHLLWLKIEVEDRKKNLLNELKVSP